MKKHLTILSMILLPLFIYGNNGKIAFANKMEGFSLDGKLNEWKHVDAIPIDLYLGDDANPTKDCKVTFKSAYKNNQIFFAIHINDNSTISDTDLEWHEQDALVLYLNFCHADKQSGLVRVILNQTSLEIQNHEENKDKCHSSFDELNIKHKYTQKNRDAYYEIAINTGLEIENLQTIGLDFHIVDIDKNEASATEVYWGPSNFNKYRMPGYLGDLVFLDDSNVHFCEVSGLVMWQETEISNTPLPQTLNIKSNKSPNFKVAVHPDSLGKFKVRLPVGAFYIVSADKNTTIFEGNGYFNHRRINTFDKVEFEVSHQNKLNIDALKLSTYSPPDYLFQPTGILHHFTEADTSIVDNFIENYKAYYDIPGVSLALIKDDKVVYTKKYGLANPINNSTFRDNSVFQIASVTKSVFSFIVMRLVEKVIIGLDLGRHRWLATWRKRRFVIFARYKLSIFGRRL